MEEKRYLKWYNKVGYGAGDIAGNVVYALLAAFCNDLFNRYGWTKCRYCGNIDCSVEDF